jgi:hypothetical protein
MKNNSEISERITEIIEYLSINPNLLAKNLGYERSQTIYDIIKKKSAPSYDFFQRFMSSEYSDKISIKWLFTGDGKISDVKKLDSEQIGSPPCEKCKLKDELIESLRREIETQGQFIKHLQAQNSPIESGQKRKEPSSGYGNSSVGEAV